LGDKTYEEHLHYLHEVVKLKLWFVWHWLRKHPEEEFGSVLRERVDIFRKTNINPDHLNPRQPAFAAPEWQALEARAGERYEQCKGDPDASRFEEMAFALFRPTIDARSRRDYAEDCAGAQLAGYQCGSLRYDAPREKSPTTVTFHIANSVRPASIFDDPGHLPGCFRRLMDECEARFGADRMYTGTWLNMHPKWLAQFPREWQENLDAPNRSVLWHYGFWGQFITARGTFNERFGQHLRETGELPYYPRSSHCSFQAMREHLSRRG